MVAVTPPTIVDDPTPRLPRYGIFQASTGILDLPTHAVGGGVTYKAIHTDLPEGLEILCAEQQITFPDPCGDWIVGTPFAIQATMSTGALGMPQDEIRSTLLARLELGEQGLVELIFSQGLFGQSPSLSNNVPPAAALVASGTVRLGIGRLEEWLAARSGIRGVIHAPAIVGAWVNDIASKEAGRWVTPLGNVVSLGNYAGLSPAGVAPGAGVTWIYITGSTVVWRNPDVLISPYEANLDLALPVRGVEEMNNQIRALARREYVVTHDGLVAGVETTLV